MGENSGRILTMSEEAVGALGDEGSEGTGGRGLRVYCFGAGSEGRIYTTAENITKSSNFT